MFGSTLIGFKLIFLFSVRYVFMSSGFSHALILSPSNQILFGQNNDVTGYYFEWVSKSLFLYKILLKALMILTAYGFSYRKQNYQGYPDDLKFRGNEALIL